MTKEDSNPVSLSKKKTENAAKMWKFNIQTMMTSWTNLGLMEKFKLIMLNGNEINLFNAQLGKIK